MIGWRGRIGIIVPSCNIVLEQEFGQLVPEGVSVHFSRASLSHDSLEELEKLVGNIPESARQLADGKVNVIGFGCTGASFMKGKGSDIEIIKKIEECTKVQATTTSTAVIAALGFLGLKKIVIATPYEDWLNEKQEVFFEESGFKVLNIRGLGLSNPEEMASLFPEQIYLHARKSLVEDADGIFISCTDIRTIEIIDKLEKDTGKPVVTSNQATMWMCLKMLGVKSGHEMYGQLLRN